MERKIKLALLSLFIGLTHLAISQSSTDIELHNRYWAYRENFRKYFTVISKEAGGGLPFSDIDISRQSQCKDVITNNDYFIKTHLNVGGDVTAFMAEYYNPLKNLSKGTLRASANFLK